MISQHFCQALKAGPDRNDTFHGPLPIFVLRFFHLFFPSSFGALSLLNYDRKKSDLVFVFSPLGPVFLIWFV